jgi:aminopeptidase N
VLSEARRRFARAATDQQALPAEIREATIEVVARHADAATWNEIVKRAKAATEPIEKERLFAALGRAVDPELASRALALSLSPEVPATFAPNVLAAAGEEHPRLAFEFARANEKAVADLVESSSRSSFIAQLAETSADPDLAREVRNYAEREIPKDARQDAEAVVADITFRAEVRERQLPALEAWVERLATRSARGEQRWIASKQRG